MSTQDPVVAGGEESGAPSTSGRSGALRWLLGLVALTLLLVLVVKTFLVQVFYIPSDSMEPGLQVGDRILVQKVSTWFGGPERGDVVVFEDPGSWLGAQGEQDDGPVSSVLGAVGLLPSDDHLVKRVVGVEGDVVECCDDQGRILVNGVPLEEDGYVRTEDLDCLGPMTGNCDWRSGVVPEGELFVLGDNRDSSGDSSAHLCTPMETDCTDDPFVDESLVTGVVWATVWPPGRFGTPENDPSSFDPVDALD